MTADHEKDLQTPFGLSMLQPESDAERDQITTDLIAVLGLLDHLSNSLKPLERRVLKRIALRLCQALGIPFYPLQINDEST